MANIIKIMEWGLKFFGFVFDHSKIVFKLKRDKTCIFTFKLFYLKIKRSFEKIFLPYRLKTQIKIISK